MSSSFNVNQADLAHILKQIQIAELQASTPGMTVSQAIQQIYNLTGPNAERDAALLPFGLRTVDGSQNNLLPGQSQFGAADTLFPRLLTPKFLNDTDGDQMPLGPPGPNTPTITNNNYGIPGSVADADPRIISNLIVDMTAANPAAVAAALKYVGITGVAVKPASDAIIAAYKNIATTATAAVAAQAAEVAALALKNTEIAQQAAADAANSAAQATLSAYNSALAQDVEVKVAAAQVAVALLVTSLGGLGSAIDALDLAATTAAVSAATIASDAATSAANFLLANLDPAHPDVTAAQAVAGQATTLLTQLTALQLALTSAGPDLGAPEFTAAGDANTLAATNASVALTHAGQLTTSQTAAVGAAASTASALAAADTKLALDITALGNATGTSDAADAALLAAQAAFVTANSALSASLLTQAAAIALNLPFQLTLSAYNDALAQDVQGKAAAAQMAVSALVVSLDIAGAPIDAFDLSASAAALAAATTAFNAATAAANFLSLNLGAGHVDVIAAQAVATDALALKMLLTGLDAALSTAPFLDAADLTTAQDANTNAANNALAASTNTSQLTTSQVAADIANAPSAALLATAIANVTQDNIVLDNAVIAVTDAFAFAATMQVAEDAAIAVHASSVLAQAAAVSADAAAQATVAAYTAALFQDVEIKADIAQTQALALVTSLGSVGAVIDAADHNAAAAAVAAAAATSSAAANAASALLANLGAAHLDVIAAEADAGNAATLLNQLTALQSALLSSGPNLDQGEFNAAQAALTSATSAQTTAITNNTQLHVSQLLAADNATNAFSVLTTANAELFAATTSHTNAVAASDAADVAATAASPHFNAVLDSYSIGHDPLGSLVIPNVSPDIGLSPGFNSAMTYFGQFFDHGLDLVTKGGAGTVYIPLQPDDPLYVVGSPTNFMALTRATVTMVNGVPQHENTTTALIDQNQTYSSHPSHQVFLREYKLDSTGHNAVSTGHLLDGSTATGSLNKAIGNWAEVKLQAKDMLGLILDDFDVNNVPLLATDQYGKFIPGANGYAQVVMPPDLTHASNWLLEGAAGGLSIPATALRTNHAFLNDIAHHAAPRFVDLDHDPSTPKTKQVADADIDANGNGVYDAGIDTLTDVNGDGQITTADFFAADKNLNGSLNESTYDNEMLNSHLITGDGRGNENIALTTIHSIFHSEHNRLVEVNKTTILQSNDLAFLNQWLAVDVAAVPTDPTVIANLTWDGERLFQAARFVTEMQYQHLVFEEFARRVQPTINPFVFTPSTTLDPSIIAEFAHTVYRFGHSMLTGTVDRLENDLTTVNGDLDQKSLLAVFLNPQMYTGSGTTVEVANANIIRGLSRDLGNEIDEFIVQDVRSSLLGLPLDLAALNIARGRETGIPTLNDARAQLFHDFGHPDLKPYTSWTDFSLHIKNPLSIINFVAAYGTHESITGATTLAGKRAAATELVLGTDEGVGAAGAPTDRLAFLNGTDAYAGGGAAGAVGTHGGLNNVDMWIGGLAESKNEFGGMLGSTFNFIFEYQMEHLQNGDRMYYLSRTQGMNLLNQLEPNTFTDMVMRNTDLGDIYSTHLNSALFVTPNHILELDSGIKQEDYNGAAAGLDPLHQDPILAILSPKVERSVSGVKDITGTHDVGGTLIFHGGEHVVLGGTEGNDILMGDRGIDTLWGDGGDDYLNPGTESDSVFGGDGDDIIVNPFGNDTLRGNKGNDVISQGSSAGGIALLFGDEGSDFITTTTNAAEVFAGQGDDFILDGSHPNGLLGNEGNDWIEGGEGFDTLSGDNSDLFFNSAIIGHDVLWGQGNDTDYDGESGDDIMVMGDGIDRANGMLGFDWTTNKGEAPTGLSTVPGQVGQPLGNPIDLGIGIFTAQTGLTIRDRWDSVEAASGWKFNDTITGTNAPTGAVGLGVGVVGAPVTDSMLLSQNVGLIRGLSDLIALTPGALRGQTVQPDSIDFANLPVDTFVFNPSTGGDILLGGAGSDSIFGKAGNDIIDGDRWLNIRIEVHANKDGTGDLVRNLASVGLDGSINSLAEIRADLLNRVINPGQLKIVREIITDGALVTDNDTAVYAGNRSDYTVTRNVNGTVTVVDNVLTPITVGGVVVPLLNNEGTDTLSNIELLKFADATIDISGRLPPGVPVIIDANGGTPTEGQLLTADTLALGLSTFSFQWQMAAVGTLPVVWTNIPAGAADGTGQTTATYTPGNNQVNQILRVVVTLNDYLGTPTVFSVPTAGVGDLFNGTGGNDNPLLTAYDDLANGAAGNDTLNGLAGNDTLNGDGGADTITGGAGNDTINGGGGTDTIVYTGAPSDYGFSFNAAGGLGGVVITDNRAGSPDGTDILRGVENLRFGATTLVLNAGTNLADTISAGGANDLVLGFDGNDILNGGGGADRLIGGNGNDTLNGGAGIDTIKGDAGNDTIIRTVGDGNDTVDGGAGIDTLAITGTALDNNLAVTYNGTSITLLDGINVATNVTNVESITADLGANVAKGDTLTYTAPGGVTVNLGTGTASGFTLIANIENVTGNGGADNLTGSVVANVLNGGGAADTLNGDAGNDTLNGGTGNDTLNGGADNDTLNGGADNDTLNGDAGNDTLNGGAGIDTLNGGADSDILIGGAGDDIVNGDAGNDTIRYTIGDGVDTVDGGTESDTLAITGTGGNNILAVTYNGSALTSFQTGAIANVESVTANLLGGADTLSYVGTTANVTVDLGAATASGFTSIASIENVTGGTGADTLTGSAAANTLNGGAGSDTLIGGGGADLINAGSDAAVDFVKFLAATEYGDTISGFGATGAVDHIQFGAALNTLFDNAPDDDIFQFASGNGFNNDNVAVDLASVEALFLNGANNEGVTYANLSIAASVATEFNSEFAITAAMGEATLLVINDTNANGAAVWQYVEDGTTAGIEAAELTLIAIINANATVNTGSFDLVV